jgi:thiol-disulfide isomerase/thioredoxin
MRKLFYHTGLLLVCCLFISVVVVARTRTTSVTCYVHNYSGSAVFLYRIENGAAISLGFKRPDKNNACTFSFEANKEAVYYLRKAGLHASAFNYAMYLRPGESKTVQVYSSNLGGDFDSCYIMEPKIETRYLQQWTSLLNDICRLGANRTKRDVFITAYDAFVRKAEAFKKASVTRDTYFNRLLCAKVDADILYVKAAAFFYFNERMNSVYDTSAAHQHFYETLLTEKFGEPACLASEYGIQLVNYVLGYRRFRQTAAPVQWHAIPFAQKIDQLSNDVVKGAYAASYLQSINSYEQFKTDIEPFHSVISKVGYGDVYQKKLDQLTVFAKGAQATNFSLPDTRDSLVSLAGFKGKVVVIDMWAMWCASCLQEKPFYEKLAEEYGNRNDLVFLGVSVDGAGKKEPWKRFVAGKGYKNMELLSEPTGDLMKYYKIEGIPRYLVFDKEGKIVTVDAPRPSTPALKKLIEQTLLSTAK